MTLHLFDGYGVEIEYMIVDRRDLSIRSICDEVIRCYRGEYGNEFDAGPVRWSNELALHVVELKTSGIVSAPVDALTGFRASVDELNDHLSEQGAMLLPTAMHPWMNPTSARLWPHDGRPIYAAYDRVFGTSGHGWVNLQSTHINLPFDGDEEFGRLHAAIRTVLPLLPGLAASSPIMEAELSNALDTRLQVYLENQRKIPSIIGSVIPEPVWTQSDYERDILVPMYRDIAPFDPDGDLQDEWLNSRGAIARFDRGSIEIRLLDTQEHPAADLAIVDLVGWTIRTLCEERYSSLAALKSLDTLALAAILRSAVEQADETLISYKPLLHALGLAGDPVRLSALWRGIAEQRWSEVDPPLPLFAPLSTILERGCLARRIRAALGASPTRARINRIYYDLAQCLREGSSFVAR